MLLNIIYFHFTTAEIKFSVFWVLAFKYLYAIEVFSYNIIRMKNKYFEKNLTYFVCIYESVHFHMNIYAIIILDKPLSLFLDAIS